MLTRILKDNRNNASHSWKPNFARKISHKVIKAVQVSLLFSAIEEPDNHERQKPLTLA